jgi:hypothetical protein
VNLMTLIRHSNSPNDDLIASALSKAGYGMLALRRQRRPSRGENQALESSLGNA